jgi:hypothetical protein
LSIGVALRNENCFSGTGASIGVPTFYATSFRSLMTTDLPTVKNRSLFDLHSRTLCLQLGRSKRVSRADFSVILTHLRREHLYLLTDWSVQ